MVIYLYRCRLHPEKDEQFIKAWSFVTEQLREKSGSRGSRLHRADDGLWYGYAQWPSIEKRESANLNHPEVVQARIQMKDAIIESMPEVILKPVADYLI